MIAGTLKRAIVRWRTPTSGLRRESHRSFVAFSYAFPLGLLGHIFFLFVFALCGVALLFYLNFLSVLMWLAALYMVRRGMTLAAGVLACAEIIAHQVAAVIVVGWQLQFQLNLLFAAMIYLAPPGRSGVKALVISSATAALLFCYVYSSHNAPQVVVVEPYAQILAITNVLLTVAAFTLFARYFNIAVAQADAVADREYKRSESLLHSILPAAVAEELKANGTYRPVRIESATVLFSDFVHFTSATRGLEPVSVIALLNGYFKQFDTLTRTHKVERLKTIGDGYMCAGGLPERNNTHPLDVCLLALDMLNYVKDQITKPQGTCWNIRIGVNTGPVTAGIVGSSRFNYDIWGETVNMASRHESSGIEGGVCVAKSTYFLTKGFFVYKARGPIEIKGGEEIEMYELKAISPKYANSDGLNEVFQKEYLKIAEGELLLGFDI